VLALVIALVIRTLLQPLRALAATIAQRGALSPGVLEARELPTEIAPMIGEIDRLLERQNEALRRENAFLADAAHALRTPLAALQLQADVLDGSSDAGERAARLAALRSGIRRAARLSDQLLSLARIDAATEMRTQSIELDSALQEVAELYSPALAAAHNHLTIAAASGARVRCDMRRLLLICTNLLDNALHHSPAEGQIQLLSAATGDRAIIEVWDEGPGLPAAELERVFQRFYRAPGAGGDGSGLGLSTVESLVKQLGGSVVLENRTDRSGLIARVTLPRPSQDNFTVRGADRSTMASSAAGTTPQTTQ
jgi:two-component system OmpR family sensor kinase